MVPPDVLSADGLLAVLFLQPIQITGIGRLAMLLPLTLSISIVYKTIRCADVRSIPLASLILCATIFLGMMGIGVSLLIAFHLLA